MRHCNTSGAISVAQHTRTELCPAPVSSPPPIFSLDHFSLSLWDTGRLHLSSHSCRASALPVFISNPEFPSVVVLGSEASSPVTGDRGLAKQSGFQAVECC